MSHCPNCADLERKLAEERQRADEQGTRAREWYSEARLLTEKLAECEEARRVEREEFLPLARKYLLSLTRGDVSQELRRASQLARIQRLLHPEIFKDELSAPPPPEVCGTCRGKGDVPLGFATCLDCLGTGRTPSESRSSPPEPLSEKCPACRGEGTVVEPVLGSIGGVRVRCPGRCNFGILERGRDE
jgi:hypothetical protein